MADQIGPNFAVELRQIGLTGLPFSWGPDGRIEFGPSITEAQRGAVLSVLAAHNPLLPDSEAVARDLARRDSELALLDSLFEAEAFARAKGTPEAVARADRILAEVNRRKTALQVP